jgi:hypothetical protein
MSVKERLMEFLSYEGIGQKRFAESIGMSSGYVNAIRKSIQPGTIHKIAMQYPNLNTGWLLTGEGEMIKDESISQNAYGDNNQIAGRDINNNGVRGNTTTTNNTTNNHKDCGACETSLLEKAIDEMGEQRKLFAEQINRLLTIIEKMNDR